jgi:hypothetical protein
MEVLDLACGHGRIVARALKPGGRFAMEMHNRDWVIRNFQPASVVERDGNIMLDKRRLELLTGRAVTERIVIRDGEVRRVPFFVRMFTFTELRDALLAAGFTDVNGYGEDGQPLDIESRRMIVVADR